MKRYIQVFCFLAIVNICYGQIQTFEELNNKLFCNAYTYGKADSATNIFLKENFPYLTKQRPKGQLSKPPIGSDSKRGIITMKFQKHPFFNFNTIQCRLNFQTIESPGEPKFEIGAELYLFFENMQSADSAFAQLIELYKAVSVQNDITTKDDQKTAKFVGNKLEYYTPKALIIFSKDGTRGYKIYFTN